MEISLDNKMNNGWKIKVNLALLIDNSHSSSSWISDESKEESDGLVVLRGN